MTKKADFYFTTVTVGKRGQIVIPAKLRKELDIDSQEQLVVMSGPHHAGFFIMKSTAFMEKQKLFNKMQEELFS